MDLMQLLSFAADNGADQVLIWANSPPVLRKKGKLTFTKMETLDRESVRDLVCSVLSDSQLGALETQRELHFTGKVREDCYVLASVYYERGSLCAVFRIAPAAAEVPARIGLPSQLTEAARASQGLVIVAAPPGHGKSLAIASLVELINSEREATVLTIEKHIIHPHVSRKAVIHQREVGRDATSFAGAISGAAEQDPDVLVIDPLPEGEAVRLALAFAGRGRLVIAAIEADYVLEALKKLLGITEAPETSHRQLAASLTLVMAMRLLPRKDGAGRVPATEVLKVDSSAAALVRAGDLKSLARRMASPEDAGTWTLDSFILKLHERGIVDTEVAKRYLLDASALEA